MLIFSHVSLIRDGRTVLSGIDATALPHGLIALLGPNGAGKSSLLAVAAGELAPAGGECEFDQLPLARTHANTLARRRALLPQQSSLEFDFSVREVVRLGGTPFPDIPGHELEGLIDSVLQLTDAESLTERRYLNLSGGERQRVQLARVLVQACAAAAQGPALLLLDEPTASLDPRHQHMLLAGLRELARKLPITVLASLHDVNLALTYAEQSWLLYEGRLVAAGKSVDVLTPERLAAVFQLPVRRVEDQLVFGLARGPLA
ncbi:ATP-binding cassette domain-containing protein [Chitinimonas arctica]|uniref:ATP-binding cassette domain-containing protein n=1 Tax=Chitinimonas arctica TaxID=2594795 RepID=A0A516SI45_9NEIS|nr:ATP-binding cassette domain-containing protein [Chitinimonas arctica]QDQ27813.1 ATP-binding cassette domain-containing protein [Chitinimonas arctica]